MKRIKRPKHGPEWHIQRDLMKFLRERGWLVERTHGNLFQQGFPDLLVAHPKYGQRWIDVKQPKKYSLTQAQQQKWPVWDHFGVGIWILVAADQENYDRLFQPPNWRDYWKDGYGPPDIEALLLEIEKEAHGVADQA
jgi:hypothetical protein